MMNTVAALLILSAGCAAFTNFWFFCIGDPQLDHVSRQRIGSWLGLWFENKWLNRKEEIDREQALQEQYEGGNLWDKVNWWKLFVCPKCFNTWLSIIAFVPTVIWILRDWRWFAAVFLYLGFASLFLDLVTCAARKK